MLVARAHEQPAFGEQPLEVDAVVLGGGMDAPLDLDIRVVAVPIEYPNALRRGDAQERTAGRARQTFDDLEQALADATIGDGDGHEAARIAVAI